MTDPLPWGLQFTPTITGADLAITLDFSGLDGRLAVVLRNGSGLPARPRELRLAAKPKLAAAAGYAWLHGRFMQRDALVRVFGAEQETDYEGRYRRPEPGHGYRSHEQLALFLPASAEPALVVGSLQTHRVFVDFELGLDESEAHIEELAIVFDLDGLVIAPGASLDLPPLLFLTGRDPQVQMEQYAREAATEMGARVPSHAPTGWCSWYYFHNRVSEDDVLANLAAMQAAKHPAEFVQIDDGFQSATGDWLTPNSKFPSGMAALAAQITAAGYRPGLWLAPFVLHESSETLRRHPEFALKTREGETLFVDTWLGRCAVLDCTHTGAEAWLRDVVHTVVREWGYSYLKLDALAYAAQSPARVAYAVEGTTAPANLRRGLEIIREAAGDDTFILGCTCHFGPALGLVDAMRIGPDVKEVWADGPNPSVRHAMRLTLQRGWMHNRWWANDPDCLIVRERDTALSAEEVRFLATAIALSGGMVVASDDLPALSPERRAMALALMPPSGVAARATPLSDGPVASAWRATLDADHSLVGFLNWSDTGRWVTWSEHLAPGEVAFDFWKGKMLGMGDLYLRPHEGVLLQVTGRTPSPRCIGDSGSLRFAGLFQRPVSGRLQLRNDLDRPRVVAVEARGYVTEVELAPGEAAWFD
ncbi:MAG: glycoside hydrolase family 36 protein [Dehalococcoidia bacterium]